MSCVLFFIQPRNCKLILRWTSSQHFSLPSKIIFQETSCHIVLVTEKSTLYRKQNLRQLLARDGDYCENWLQTVPSVLNWLIGCSRLLPEGALANGKERKTWIYIVPFITSFPEAKSIHFWGEFLLARREYLFISNYNSFFSKCRKLSCSIFSKMILNYT